MYPAGCVRAPRNKWGCQWALGFQKKKKKKQAGLHPRALGSNQSCPASHRNQPPLCPLNGTVEAYHIPHTSPSRTNPPDENLYAPPSVRPTRRGLAFTNRAPRQPAEASHRGREGHCVGHTPLTPELAYTLPGTSLRAARISRSNTPAALPRHPTPSLGRNENAHGKRSRKRISAGRVRAGP